MIKLQDGGDRWDRGCLMLSIKGVGVDVEVETRQVEPD